MVSCPSQSCSDCSTPPQPVLACRAHQSSKGQPKGMEAQQGQRGCCRATPVGIPLETEVPRARAKSLWMTLCCSRPGSQCQQQPSHTPQPGAVTLHCPEVYYSKLWSGKTEKNIILFLPPCTHVNTTNPVSGTP